MKLLGILFKDKRYIPLIVCIVALLMVQAYCELVLPSYMSRIVDIGIAQGGVEDAAYFNSDEYAALDADTKAGMQRDYMTQAALMMIVFTLLACVVGVVVGLLASRMSAAAARRLRREAFTNIMGFSSVEVDKFGVSSIITRCTNDIQQVQMALMYVLRVVLFAPIMAIGGIYMVANTGAGLSWVVVVTIVMLAAVIGTLLGLALPKFKRMQILIDKVNLVSREVLTGLLVIRAFNRENYEKDRFDGANTTLFKNQLFTTKVMSMFLPFVYFIMNIIMVIIVWVGGPAIDAGDLNVGDMMAVMSYMIFIVMAFMLLSVVATMLPRANVSAGRVMDIIDTESSIIDRPAAELLNEEREFEGRVVFDDVCFRYQNADEDMLSHISFTAEPGHMTAIIGGTGSGKSTLINLVPRLFDVTGGSITIDGVDVRDLSLRKLRSFIGVVPQRGVLFSGTIESNIKYSGDDVTDEAMAKAAEIAQAADFIGTKEGKYESEISQGGTNVSGGQRQRLAIARAVAKDPKVCIFDDSFSALDYKTDSRLRKALAKNLGDATILIVAQRIATILRADKIIVLDQGKVVGEGTHGELLKTCEVYREIAESQLSEEELNK
ncbi:MAG: ABC transporter ATP-binding protein/permease [Clostridiales bacterium]|nr:ABC transporter ATP-binding protein/permease [Clostridiales bacterium]